MATEDTQDADAAAKDRRNDEYRERETVNLTDAEKNARKAEAESLIGERDAAMKRGMTNEIEAIDERLRALGYREEQSTNADVQREFARRLPDSEKRRTVAAGAASAEVLTESGPDDTTKAKGNK